MGIYLGKGLLMIGRVWREKSMGWVASVLGTILAVMAMPVVFGVSDGRAAAPDAATEAASGADDVVATVNGTEIRFSDIALAEEENAAALARVPADVRFEYLLSLLIDRRIVSLEARAHQMQDDPGVRRRLAYFEDKALRDVYWVSLLNGELSEEVLKEAYQKKYVDAEGEEEVHARHILVASEADAQAAISAVEGGEDFVEAAKRLSTGPSGADGGDLGFFKREDMVGPFAEAAFALEAGQISDPVQTKFGWHVIKVEERRQASVPDFAAVRDQLTFELAQEKGQALMKGLRANAKVEISGAPVTPGQDTAPQPAP